MYFIIVLALAAVLAAVVCIWAVLTPPRGGQKTQVRYCINCTKSKLSKSDTHTLCFHCLGPDHPIDKCGQCLSLTSDAKNRRIRRQIIWKVSNSVDPPSRSLTVSGARVLALQHLTLQQIQDYGVFGVPDGIDGDAADAISLVSQGDGVRSAVVEVAVDLGLGDISHYDLSVFEAQTGTGKSPAVEHPGGRKSGISLGAALAVPIDLNPSGRLSDWGHQPGTVQGLPLPAGAGSATTQYYSNPFAAAIVARREGSGAQVTPDLSEVTTPVQARPAALFQTASLSMPSPPVGTPDTNLQQLVQNSVQEAMDGVHRKMDAIIQAMAHGPRAGGDGGHDAVVPPMHPLVPNVDPVVTYPLGGGATGAPSRDEIPLGGSAVSMSGIDAGQPASKPSESGKDRWSYDQTLAHYLTKLDATGLVARPQPSVDPMLQISGQAKARAPPGGLLLDQPRVDLLQGMFNQPKPATHTYPGSSRFRMESGLFSSVFVTPQVDDIIADKIKRKSKGFVSRAEVNHWATSLGPLYESSMASFRLAYHQLWMIRGLHADLGDSPPEHQAALVQHLMASALESLKNASQGAVNVLVLLRSMLLSLTD